jgi:N utilization substance protein B
MANRRVARELLLRLIYQMSVTGEWTVEEKDAFLAECEDGGGGDFCLPGKVGRRYFDRVIKSVCEKRDEIDGAIESASDNWRMGRISKVDLAIMRLAVAELWYVDEVQTAVTINEAVELAKQYGTAKSYEFVNGVLGRVVRNGERGERGEDEEG